MERRGGKAKNGENFSHLFVPHIFLSKKHVCKTKTRLIKGGKRENFPRVSFLAMAKTTRRVRSRKIVHRYSWSRFMVVEGKVFRHHLPSLAHHIAATAAST
jgi:hypothetical protein